MNHSIANLLRRRLNIVLKQRLSKLAYPGAPLSQFVNTLEFSKDWPTIPTYRVLDTSGNIIQKSQLLLILR
jgi:hypothetical protein